MMRILHLDSERGWRGGQQQVAWLAEGLRERGHAQCVIGPQGSELLTRLSAQRFDTRGYRLYGTWDPRAGAALRKLSAEFRPDIVHAHAGNAHTLALRAFGGRVPIVVTRRVDFAIKDNARSRRKYAAPGQHFIAISNAIRDVLVRGGVAPANITVVPSGVDVARVRGGNRAAIRAELGVSEHAVLVGFVGALVDHKAPWLLAEALPVLRRIVPHARIVYAGDGPERARIEAVARTAGAADAIHFLGWRADIADVYAALDLFSLPSKEEGLGTALIDAQAAGVPCVVTAAGGMIDIVHDGENGRVVPIGDANALGAALGALWMDEPLRHRFTTRGLAVVEERFTKDAMVAGNEAVYAAAIGTSVSD